MADKPNGTDEPTAATPAKADDVARPAPAAPAKLDGLDWQTVLKQAETKSQETVVHPDDDPDVATPMSTKHTPDSEAPLTEDDGFEVIEKDEPVEDAVEQTQAGSADDAAATDTDEVDQAVDDVETEDLRRRLQEKTESEARLLTLKGRMGQRIGDLLKQVRAFQGEQPAATDNGDISPEVEAAQKAAADAELRRLMDNPKKWLTHNVNELLGEAAVELDAISRKNEIENNQTQGFRRFQARYKERIPSDPMQFAQGAEGKAVKAILDRDPMKRAALEKFMETGNDEGIALVLSDVYDTHLARIKGTEAQGKKALSVARTTARKPPVIPSAPRARAPRPMTQGGINVSDPKNWQKVLSGLKRAGY